MKAVLVSQQNPTYDDLPGIRYHFPRRYLKTVQAAINDSIVYYESGRIPGQSRRDGRMSYFGVARLTSVDEDYMRPDHFYAHLKDYLPFSNLVPFRVRGELFESSLKSTSRQVSGVAQSAVRPISDYDFEKILSLAFQNSEEAVEQTEKTWNGFEEPPLMIERLREHVIYERAFRDRVFREQIHLAYDKRCAISGLRLINGGGRAEAQAAHIVPVAENGPDMVQNGLSLSGTVHWMFDRGFISVDDDLRILKANKHIPAELESLISKTEYLIAPQGNHLKPHPKFLRWHRENRFKG